MADKTRVDLSGDDLKSLSVKTLSDLHEKFGLELSVRSSREAIDKILTEVGKAGTSTAEFTRGFDRTSGGFDRYYDRDIAMKVADELINPADVLEGLAKKLKEGKVGPG